MATRIPLKLILLLVSTFVATCGPGPEARSLADAQARAGTARSNPLRFTLEDKNRRQSLEVRRRGASVLDVTITVEGVCSRTETGTARIGADEGDVEVEVDPEGEGHPVEAFVLTTREKCEVEIRLADPERDFAWLREGDCAASCPLSSKPMTRK